MSKKIQLLYLLQSGDLYKIGISNDVNSRIKSLQTGSGTKLNAWHITRQKNLRVQ